MFENISNIFFYILKFFDFFFKKFFKKSFLVVIKEIIEKDLYKDIYIQDQIHFLTTISLLLE